MVKEKKKFKKVVEWKEGSAGSRWDKVVGGIALPLLIWFLWTQNDIFTKIAITAWVLIYGIEYIVNKKFGKREITYQEL